MQTAVFLTDCNCMDHRHLHIQAYTPQSVIIPKDIEFDLLGVGKGAIF